MQYSHNGQAMSTLSVPAGAWEELRREARKLESEIDGKLAAYAKFASGPSGGMGVSDALLAGDSLDAQSADIEALLQRLSDVNSAMSGAVAGGDARSHTLARHKDIVLEFTQEFRRVKNTVDANREHASLLGGGRIRGGGGDFGDSSASSQLIRERSTIHSSTSKVDEVIGQAQATAAALVSQRGIFANVANNLSNIGSRFPVVNNMLTAIKRKKSKDTIILSVVVALCTGFTLIYWLSK